MSQPVSLNMFMCEKNRLLRKKLYNNALKGYTKINSIVAVQCSILADLRGETGRSLHNSVFFVPVQQPQGFLLPAALCAPKQSGGWKARKNKDTPLYIFATNVNFMTVRLAK